MSRGALHRHHRHLATRLLAAQRKQRMRLGGVVGRRSRAVGVDVAKVGRREAALGERLEHSALDALARRLGGGHVVGIARGAEARDLGQGLRTARQRMLEGFEHHGAGAFARHETTATLIEGQRCLSGVVDLGKRA